MLSQGRFIFADIDAKKKRFQIHGFKSNQEYIQALKPHLPLDPLTLPQPSAGKPLGMVIATADTVVPTRNQMLLKKVWLPGMILEVSGNHKFSIIKTWLFHKKKIVDFFRTASKTN